MEALYRYVVVEVFVVVAIRIFKRHDYFELGVLFLLRIPYVIEEVI